jgi:hypothetical protein
MKYHCLPNSVCPIIKLPKSYNTISLINISIYTTSYTSYSKSRAHNSTDEDTEVGRVITSPSIYIWDLNQAYLGPVLSVLPLPC